MTKIDTGDLDSKGNRIRKERTKWNPGVRPCDPKWFKG